MNNAKTNHDESSLRAAGYSAIDLAIELREAGASVAELRKAGFRASTLLCAGFTTAELRWEGYWAEVEL